MSKLYSFKILKLFLGVFIFFFITYLFFEVVFGLSDKMELQVKNISAGFVPALFIIALLIADILIPVPSSIVMIISGMLFGGFLGGLIALTGSLAGSLINFQMSRILGQTKIKRWLGEKEYNTLSKVMQKYGAYIVIFTRMVPLATESVSAIAGISNMKFARFILMNIVGFLPIVFFYSYSGAIYKEEPSSIFIVLVIGFLVPVLIWYLLLKMIKPKYAT